MSETWQLKNINHINVIAEGFEATIEHFRDRVGFTLDRKNPDYYGIDFCLMSLGGVMFAFFIPKAKGEGGQGRLLARYGDFYNGLEYRVDDVASARLVCEERNVRIIQDSGGVFHTYPGSTFGVSFEIFDGDFSRFAQPAAFWEHVHPLGLKGLARVSVAVNSVAAAEGRLVELAGSARITTISRPRAAAKGVQLQVGEAVWELLEPTGDGPLAEFLDHYDQRMRSVVFKARDLAQVQRHLGAQGFDFIPGDGDDSLAIDPGQNHNLRFEFVE